MEYSTWAPNTYEKKIYTREVNQIQKHFYFIHKCIQGIHKGHFLSYRNVCHSKKSLEHICFNITFLEEYNMKNTNFD